MRRHWRMLLCWVGLLILSSPLSEFACESGPVPEPLRALLGLLGLPYRLLGPLGFTVGTMLFALVLVVPMLRQPFCSHVPQPLAVPAVGGLWVAAQALPLIFVPPGSSVRLMGWAALASCSALAVTAVGVMNAALGWREGRNKVVRVLAMVLSVGVLAVPSLALRAAASVVGFTLSP